MKNDPILYLTIFFSFFFALNPAYAQNALNETEIEKYLSTLPKLRTLNAIEPEETDSTRLAEGQTQNDELVSHTPISDNLERMRNHSTFDSFSEIVIEAGFDNPAQWAAVGDKIMLAYNAYFLTNPADSNAPSLEEMKQDLSEQQKSVSANQFITPEQKKLLLNKIENSMAMLNDPNYIANENISIIRPFIGRLNSYLRNTNDTY